MVQSSCLPTVHSAGSSVHGDGYSETSRRHVPDDRNFELDSCQFTEKKFGNNAVNIRGKREQYLVTNSERPSPY
jgi:hypothetical protein